MPTVFISHSSADKSLLENLKKELTNFGIDSYVAEEDIKAGESLPEKIEQNIDNAQFVVAIITAQSNRSPSVNQELGYAKRGNKLIIALKEEGVETGVLLQGLEYISFSVGDITSAIKSAVSYINHLIEKNKTKVTIGAVIILGLAALLIYFSSKK